MSGRPKPYDGHLATCTGDWACDGESHCACWWASTPTHPRPCCQCGHDRRNEHERYPVFVYGTLRPGCGNDRLWRGRAVTIHDGTAILVGYKLVTNGHFPYMIPATTAQTVGTLIVPDDEHYDDVLDRMDMLEGVPRHYLRIRVAVLVEGGEPCFAWTYVPATRNHDLMPECATAGGRFDWHAERASRYQPERNR